MTIGLQTRKSCLCGRLYQMQDWKGCKKLQYLFVSVDKNTIYIIFVKSNKNNICLKNILLQNGTEVLIVLNILPTYLGVLEQLEVKSLIYSSVVLHVVQPFIDNLRRKV